MTTNEPVHGGEPGSLRTLLMRVARLSRQAWVADLEPYGLSPHLARALTVIAHAEGGGTRAADLAERLRVSPRSATEVVDALADKGLVQRSPDPGDRRAKVIGLTDSGARLVAELDESRSRRDDEIFAGLDERDQGALARILTRVLEQNERG